MEVLKAEARSLREPEIGMKRYEKQVVRGLRDYSAPEFCSALRCFVEIRAKDAPREAFDARKSSFHGDRGPFQHI